VLGVVLADADDLGRQDRGQQPDLGQRPHAAGGPNRAERVVGNVGVDLPAFTVLVDGDERHAVGMGDPAYAHGATLTCG
jgi:hypothetical protein